MICCTIHNKSYRQIEAILKTVEMAEIRLDLCELSDEQIEKLFSSDIPLIATCRAWGPKRKLSQNEALESARKLSQNEALEAERRLSLAIRSGAHYADLEIEAPMPVAKRIARLCNEEGTMLIRSWHDFVGTPSLDELRQMVDKCRQGDGSVVKIVTTACSDEDAGRLLSLYRYYTPESLVAFAMEDSPRTRIGCLAKGAPWSYCASDGESPAAKGQLGYEQMYKAVYGERKALKDSVIRVPSSKSYAQRAIIAAALSEGTSTLRGFTICGDSRSALNVAESLGATISRKRGPGGTTTLEITGIDARPGMLPAAHPENHSEALSLNVGESGLLARLTIPLLCQLSSQPFEIKGEGTLRNRPLQGITANVEALGGTISHVADSSNSLVPNNTIPHETGVQPSYSADCVPFTVKGPLKPGLVHLDGSKSSQLVSGAVVALCLSPRNSTVKVQNPTSIPYLYMTLDILRKFGIKVRSEMYGGRRMLDDDWSKCTEIVLKIKENQFYKAADLTLEGDWSAASVFLAAGAIFGSVKLEGLNTTSLQADLCMLDLLMDAGASLSQLDEPTGTISASKAPLTAIRADLSNSPDLFPVLAVTCAFCQGTSVLKGVHRLAHKESDRAEGILSMLKGLGVKAYIKGDSLYIEGQSLDSRILTDNLLRGGNFTSNGDHRMVMALRLAELGADGPIEIDDTACVAKSYPQFNEVWDKMTGNEHIRQ